MNKPKWIARTVVAVAALVACPALALVGPANEHGPLEPHVVMVLQSLPGAAAFCSGVVLAPDVVLTAAHCVNTVKNTVIHYHDASARPVLSPVVAIAVHPLYRRDAIRTRRVSIDLALIHLAGALPAPFQPATLASTRAFAVGERLRIAGFGLTHEGKGTSGGTFHWGVLAVREPLSQLLLWSEDPNSQGFGACTGDSGGPVFAEGAEDIVAIANWTTGHDRKTHCGALTQGALIAPQRDWIENIVRSWRKH